MEELKNKIIEILKNKYECKEIETHSEFIRVLLKEDKKICYYLDMREIGNNLKEICLINDTRDVIFLINLTSDSAILELIENNV